ncbi:MAG: pyruvate kinase, partial [bacterium]
DHAFHHRVFRAIREAESQAQKPIAILQDLPGPKLRIGKFSGGEITLTTGSHFQLVKDLPLGDSEKVGFEDVGWFEEVKTGDRILLGDGNVVLKVISKSEGRLTTSVVSGGKVRSQWGLALPDSQLSLRALTPRDEDHLLLGLEWGVDAVALSFVSDEEDLHRARHFIQAHISEAHLSPLLIAKIERPDALEHIQSIIEAADGIMVARGDLGITLPIERLPTLQKELIRLARQKGRVVITATQMLESMTYSARPTRAEVTDVANAVYDGTDAVMLSGETAVGVDPVNVVETMHRILEEAEPNAHFPPLTQEDRSVESAIADAVGYLVKDLSARAVLVPLTSGSTAARISRLRLGVPILAGVRDLPSARQTLLRWGTVPFLTPTENSFYQSIHTALETATRLGWVSKGERVVATGGFPLDRPGITNFVRVVTWGEEI